MKKTDFVIFAIMLCLTLSFNNSVFSMETPIHQPFNNQIDSISQSFQGDNVENLYNELKQKFPPKNEFETTNIYLNRLVSEDYNSLYSFVIDSYTISVLSKYNADRQNFDFQIPMYPTMNLDNTAAGIESYPTVITKMIQDEKSTYIASNSFGNEVQVTKYTGKEYGIAITNLKDLHIDRYTNCYNVSIKVPLDKAKNLKENLGILMIGKLKISGKIPSYFYSSIRYFKPTISNPKEFSYLQYLIYTDLKEIWVYDSSTGEIFKKIIINKK